MGPSLGEYATVIGVSVTIITGLVSLILNAQYQRMRREITDEISRSRHATIDRVIGNLSEVKLALDEKVNKEMVRATDARARTEARLRRAARHESPWRLRHRACLMAGAWTP